MKLRITKDEYEALSDEFKAEYKASGDGYVLKLDREVYTTEQVDEKIDGLTTKNSELLGKLKTAKEDLEAAKASKGKGDGENARLLREAKERIDNLENEIAKGKTQSIVRKIQDELKSELGKISEGKALTQLFRLTKHRVGVHEGEGTVLSEEGRPTISSVKELVRQIKDSGEYDNLISGSKANGGGEQGSRGGKSDEKWADFKPNELSKIRQEDPARYTKLKETRGK